MTPLDHRFGLPAHSRVSSLTNKTHTSKLHTQGQTAGGAPSSPAGQLATVAPFICGTSLHARSSTATTQLPATTLAGTAAEGEAEVAAVAPARRGVPWPTCAACMGHNTRRPQPRWVALLLQLAFACVALPCSGSSSTAPAAAAVAGAGRRHVLASAGGDGVSVAPRYVPRLSTNIHDWKYPELDWLTQERWAGIVQEWKGPTGRFWGRDFLQRGLQSSNPEQVRVCGLGGGMWWWRRWWRRWWGSRSGVRACRRSLHA